MYDPHLGLVVSTYCWVVMLQSFPLSLSCVRLAISSGQVVQKDQNIVYVGLNVPIYLRCKNNSSYVCNLIVVILLTGWVFVNSYLSPCTMCEFEVHYVHSWILYLILLYLLYLGFFSLSQK